MTPSGSYFCDYQPDMFLFNFCGQKGTFMIDNEGMPLCDKKVYKVDISELKEQLAHEMVLPKSSSIKITDANGYIYIFGGKDLTGLEFSMSFKPGYNIDAGASVSTILAWHLTEIIAPNGRSVRFIYQEEKSLSNIHSPIWQSSVKRNTSSEIVSYVFKHDYTAVKSVCLRSIIIDDITIEFNNSVEETLNESGTNGIFNDSYFDFNKATYQLDNIKVKKGNETLYTYNFTYENRSKRRFLSSIKMNDNGVYKFEYNHPSAYPQPSIETDLDFWGYWKEFYYNDSPGVINDRDFYKFDSIQPFSYPQSVIEKELNLRRESVYKDLLGLLSKITYPSGGYTAFEYGGNQYKKRIDIRFQVGGSEIPNKGIKTEDTVQRAGGARIEKITNFGASGEKITEKRYLYLFDKDNSASCSGFVYQYPPYCYLKTGEISYLSNWRENYNIEESHIGYSNVFEYNMDNSYTQYTFSDYITNPDADNSKIRVCPGAQLNSLTLAATSVNRFTSSDKKRGLLTKRLCADSKGQKVFEEEYTYKNIRSNNLIPSDIFDSFEQQQPTDYIVTFRSIIGGGMVHKIFLEDYPLIYKSAKKQTVNNKEYFLYNSWGLLQKNKALDSHGDTIKTVYTYPPDYPTDETMKTMKINNQLNNIVVEKRYKNDQLLETRKNSYAIPPMSLGAYINATYYSLGENPLLQLKSFSNTNIHINPTVETNMKTGLKTIYLWGYNKQYIVAEITNASYENVTAILGTVPGRFDFSGSDTDLSKLNALRTSLPHALVTTYTYKPLVGMTSKTDPRGITTHYEYDGFNRLKRIYTIENGVEKTIQTYDYHYKP